MILQDRVAIVTGGGFGIGRAYSLGIAREGGKVVIADITDEGSPATAYAIEKEGRSPDRPYGRLRSGQHSGNGQSCHRPIWQDRSVRKLAA